MGKNIKCNILPVKRASKIGFQGENKWNVFLTVQFCLKMNSAGPGIFGKVIILWNMYGTFSECVTIYVNIHEIFNDYLNLLFWHSVNILKYTEIILKYYFKNIL